MNNPNYFILVPADTPHGPVKGAYALANELSKTRSVTLVMIKDGPGASSFLNNKVNKICLEDKYRSWFRQLIYYRSLIKKTGPKDKVVSISFCFQGDFMNSFCKSRAYIGSSVRGNLPKNYSADMGLLGYCLAIFHILRLRVFDHVFSMSTAMSKQLREIAGINSDVVGNFIEENIEVIRSSKLEMGDTLLLVFVGSLSKRKRPLLLLDAVRKLVDKGVKVKLDMLGTGPMQLEIEMTINKLGLEGNVNLLGFVKNPLEVVKDAHLMILPSTSEGASRAVLEALFLGVPCVLSNVDGNKELIQDGHNGALFDDDADLVDAILRASNVLSENARHSINNLLPEVNRQKFSTDLMKQILEN